MLLGMMIFPCCMGVVWAQPDYSHLGFAVPVDIPMVLSGNFGEFRRNHFHTGIDIKTQGREGLPLYASHDGHVSRIGVGPYGYGLVLYIDHPNGYTTVYGHMQRFRPDIAAWVEAQQYACERFAVQLFPPADLFPVRQGDRIGWSGNSGGSFGPHLHFEVRQTETEFPMNCLLFGFDIADTRPPEVPAIWVFDTGTGAGKRYPVKRTASGFRITDAMEIKAGVSYGFGVETIDRLNGASNRCGVYSIRVSLGGEKLYEHRMEALNFATKRYINAHMVASEYANHSRDVHRCYRLPNNKLDIYCFEGTGHFSTEHMPTPEFIVRDSYGNETVVIGSLVEAGRAVNVERDVFSWDRDEFRRTDSANVFIRKGTLYDDCPADLALEKSPDGALSPAVRVGNPDIPLQEKILVELPVGALPAEQQSKALLTRWDPVKRRHRACGGKYQFGWVSAWVTDFGQYQVMIDDSAPVIETQRLGQQNTLRFRITDDLSGIAHYEGRVDGAWKLFTYDYKKNRLEWRFGDDALTRGRHEVEITVRDERGNERILRERFTL